MKKAETRKAGILTQRGLAIVTYPFSDEAGRVLVERFLDVVDSMFDDILLISGPVPVRRSKVTVINLGRVSEGSLPRKLCRQFVIQSRAAICLLKKRNRFANVVFLIGAGSVIPISLCRIIRKKAILVLTGLGSRGQIASLRGSEFRPSYREITRLYASEAAERLDYFLSSILVAYTKSMIPQMGLESHTARIRIAHEHFVEKSRFRSQVPLNDRLYDFGFIGRLSEEKGILKFLEALPIVLENCPGMRALVGGDGKLRPHVEKFVSENRVSEQVSVIGWIPYDEIPSYLNRLKLVVLPSYTEGLPKLMLEAMACGTIVIAAAVGAIPDIIEDGKTGFLLKSNDPSLIAEAIASVLGRPDLETIGRSARLTVLNRFTLDAAKRMWSQVLEVN